MKHKIENYPYPYVIGKLCWEFPCMIPDDWQGQNIQQPNNPRTVEDMLAAIDATVVKKGIADLVFHPGDGVYDKSTLFLDHIAFPTGVLAFGKGVIVSAAPAIFYAEDTNGDGTADLQTELYQGFGEGNQQHRVNGFERGLDNWIYLANGDSGGTIQSIATGEVVDIRGQDLRIRPATGAFDLHAGQTHLGRSRSSAT